VESFSAVLPWRQSVHRTYSPTIGAFFSPSSIRILSLARQSERPSHILVGNLFRGLRGRVTPRATPTRGGSEWTITVSHAAIRLCDVVHADGGLSCAQRVTIVLRCSIRSRNAVDRSGIGRRMNGYPDSWLSYTNRRRGMQRDY
jgi:hypothetical protein